MSYVGEWTLIPELSLYASGVPPISGRYTISQHAEHQLALEVVWRLPGDTADKSTRFGGIPDGSRVALPASDAGPDSYSLTHIDGNTRDSAAYRGPTLLAYARRVVSRDGTLLAVVQEALGADGAPVRNFQVYRRAVR